MKIENDNVHLTEMGGFSVGFFAQDDQYNLNKCSESGYCLGSIILQYLQFAFFLSPKTYMAFSRYTRMDTKINNSLRHVLI